MRVRRPCLVSLVASVVILAACNSDKGVTPPNVAKPCGSGGTVQLSPLQAITIPCTAGTTVTLQGGGASYLVVPQYATGSAANRATSYTIGIANGATSNVVSLNGPSLDIAPPVTVALPSRIARGARQRAFDAALMEYAREVAANRQRRISAQAPGSPAMRTVVPAIGSVQKFHVLSSESPVQFKAVGARLEYIGANILIYVDTLSPANGFTSDQLQAFGQLFDQTLYPIDLNTFGPPSDIDQNGHVIMLLSPVVNALTPSADCATKGIIGGFFVGSDLAFAPGDTSSNQGEIFYSRVPDPNATVSCSETVANLLALTPPTFLHELQHLINYGQHVVVRGAASERGWLDEGLSIVAEELGSIYYEDKFPPPTGRSNPDQLWPDSSQGFISSLLPDSYAYLLKTDTATVTLHSDADLGFAWRGGDWLLVRWLGDVKGTAIYKTLVQSSLTGTANIANAAGESFDALFGDFSLAVYTDSIPGTPKSSIPVRNRFGRRNLRQMYNRLWQTSGMGSDPQVPRQFPIVLASLVGSTAASMVPGTMSFYRLNTTATQTTVTIDFGSTPGTALSEGLHPQLSIFRLPPGF